MNNRIVGIDKNLCDRFTPLKDIPNSMREELLIHAKVTGFDVYSNIISHLENPHMVHFLIEGCADIRHSFDRRKNLSSNDPKCTFPLEELITIGGNIRAITPCKVLIVNRNYLKEIQIKSRATINHKNRNRDNTSLFLSDFIEKDSNSHWKTLFYQSQLALSLTPKQIHKVFRGLRDIFVHEGEYVIKHQTKGEFFYILKDGHAVILPGEKGEYYGDKYNVSLGGYFGEEALISGLPRNADIIMKSDGIVGRLDKKDFDEYVKKSLVRTPSLALLHNLANPIFCDVRTPAEYKRDHMPHSINVPVGKIRKYISSFDRKLSYVVTPEGGSKSELATYLMRQAGIDVYYMDSLLRKQFIQETEGLRA